MDVFFNFPLLGRSMFEFYEKRFGKDGNSSKFLSTMENLEEFVGNNKNFPALCSIALRDKSF